MADNVYCFDFDGVICDSARETGSAGWRAAGAIWPGDFRGEAPVDFLVRYQAVRPVLETGYESIVLARLLVDGVPVESILADAPRLVRETMDRHGLERERLVALFSRVRDAWLAGDLPGWLVLNDFYERVPGIVAGLAARAPVFIITTKQHRYAMALLERAGIDLSADHVFGLEAGKKTKVLVGLMAREALAGAVFHFFEDRLPTLEKVAAEPSLAGIRLYLAAWGYVTRDELALAGKLAYLRVLTLSDFAHTFGSA